MQDEYTNNGTWNIQDFNLILGACHTPRFDALMTTYRLAQRAVADDEARIRRLPRPWLGDPFHRDLKRQMAAAKARAMEYLLAHKDIIVIHGH